VFLPIFDIYVFVFIIAELSAYESLSIYEGLVFILENARDYSY
jgi:hypothetical protein